MRLLTDLRLTILVLSRFFAFGFGIWLRPDLSPGFIPDLSLLIAMIIAINLERNSGLVSALSSPEPRQV